MGSHYLANQKLVILMVIYIYHCYYYRMVHAFTSAGILPSQYINMSSFAAIGTVGHAYINQGICILLYFMPLFSQSTTIMGM